MSPSNMRDYDVLARVRLLSTAEGGRCTPVASGYRPHHRVLPDYLTTGSHLYLDREWLSPGDSAEALITFITPEAYPHCLAPGDTIEIGEGGRIVGYAEILEVHNSLLLRS